VKEREKLYADVADLILDADDEQPAVLADRIVASVAEVPG
jgi:shikimate kinase